MTLVPAPDEAPDVDDMLGRVDREIERSRWHGKLPGELTDEELRAAAEVDEVWAAYVATKRPELVDWDF